MKLQLLAFTAATSVALAADPPGTWTPKTEFSLGDASFSETMHWVSGWAYALTELGRASAKAGSGPLCLPKQGFVESRVLLDVLNAKYKGQRITAEQASQALWLGATSHYRCGKGEKQ
jgi:hypothetical protein